MTVKKKVVEEFRKILDELKVDYSKILLFGSRARSDFDEESDWDFLIVTKKSLTLKEKKILWLKIYNKFHEYFPFISIDIIVKDAESFENERLIVNTISSEASLEGVEV
jgi:predicted nucleotidyltransferase